MTNTLTFRVDQFLPYPASRVWRALTDPELLARWFMPNDFQLRVGHHFTFKAIPIPSVNFDGTAHCEVLDFEIERRLCISWAGNNGLNSTVVWRLEPEGNGTHLFLEHDGFDPDDPIQQMSYRMMGGGWRLVLSRFAEFLDTEGTMTISPQTT